MNHLTISALQYLSDGHHILALTQKRPNTRYHPEWSWDQSIHGEPESEEDVLALSQVFEDPTTTGVAILIPQHMLVADVDTEEAGELFKHLVGDDEWLDTKIGRTPNGLHLWYFAPGADKSLWLGGRTLLFKGFGGYVAAAPSLHFNSDGVKDGVYTWINQGPMDFLPDGIAEYMADQARRAVENPMQAYHGIGRTVATATRGDGPFSAAAGTLVLYGSANIEGLCRAIREAPDGNQNNVIAWAAMQARDEGVTLADAMPQLLEAALQGNHPRERAITTIKGAFTRGRRA